MYTTLIQKIKQTLESVSLVKEVFAFPASKITQYPAVVFYPQDFTNAYETNDENAKEYRFSLFAVVSLGNLSEQQAFEGVMPKVVDAIVEKFDQDWDYGTTVDGHRIRTLLGFGNWGVVEGKEGKEVFAELTLTIKSLTTN